MENPVNFGHDGAPVMVRIPPDPALPPERQNWEAAWPRRDYLELTAVPGAVPSARHHVRLVLKEWLAIAPALNAEQAYEIEQITAELVANAVTATQAVQWAAGQPPVRLWLLGRSVMAMVAIWDGSTAVPAPRAPAEGDESGRGLLLVEALARWGYYLPSPGYGGKVVYALIPR
jgi:anti-sigma regulatory factor (Ser/Thr protein kinase)